jgi:flagellin-specific chaperone FliS
VLVETYNLEELYRRLHIPYFEGRITKTNNPKELELITQVLDLFLELKEVYTKFKETNQIADFVQLLILIDKISHLVRQYQVTY